MALDTMFMTCRVASEIGCKSLNNLNPICFERNFPRDTHRRCRVVFAFVASKCFLHFPRERERDFCSFLAQVQLKQVGNLNSSNMIMKSTGVCVSNQTLLHQNTRAAFVSMKRLYALQCGVDALLSRRVRKFIFSSNVN